MLRVVAVDPLSDVLRSVFVDIAPLLHPGESVCRDFDARLVDLPCGRRLRTSEGLFDQPRSRPHPVEGGEEDDVIACRWPRCEPDPLGLVGYPTCRWGPVLSLALAAIFASPLLALVLPLGPRALLVGGVLPPRLVPWVGPLVLPWVFRRFLLTVLAFGLALLAAVGLPPVFALALALDVARVRLLVGGVRRVVRAVRADVLVRLSGHLAGCGHHLLERGVVRHHVGGGLLEGLADPHGHCYAPSGCHPVLPDLVELVWPASGLGGEPVGVVVDGPFLPDADDDPRPSGGFDSVHDGQHGPWHPLWVVGCHELIALESQGLCGRCRLAGFR